MDDEKIFEIVEMWDELWPRVQQENVGFDLIDGKSTHYLAFTLASWRWIIFITTGKMNGLTEGLTIIDGDTKTAMVDRLILHRTFAYSRDKNEGLLPVREIYAQYKNKADLMGLCQTYMRSKMIELQEGFIANPQSIRTLVSIMGGRLPDH